MPSTFLSQHEQQQIIEAIQQAEANTSGEIRVHIEPHGKSDPVERAKEVFAQLGMHQTALHNGVLIYVAYDDHRVAIIGDKGIHEKVGEHFWQHEIELITEHFKRNEYAQGICAAIHAAGEKLKHHFPFKSDDKNELSNDISFGGKP